jgi:hypothetical protein
MEGGGGDHHVLDEKEGVDRVATGVGLVQVQQVVGEVGHEHDDQAGGQPEVERPA